MMSMTAVSSDFVAALVADLWTSEIMGRHAKIRTYFNIIERRDVVASLYVDVGDGGVNLTCVK